MKNYHKKIIEDFTLEDDNKRMIESKNYKKNVRRKIVKFKEY